MNHNPNECDIVQDLLPLYYDHACSPASCELVRQHLADCADCEKIYEDLANHTIDNVIETESREILERHAKKERNLAYKAGIVIAALLLVPILITFIVSMAGGSGLGVFSVVTASMMLVAALTVVPLISSQKRLMKCILCGVGALLLILFFVNAMNGGGEFFFWSVPTVFGLSVVFFPLVIREMTLPPVLSDKKSPYYHDLGYSLALPDHIYRILPFRIRQSENRMHCGNSSDDRCMALFPHNSLSSGQWFYQRRSVYTSLQYMDYLLQ